MKSAVHFGAGNIGRGFIGLLLHQAGYQITFVDVNAAAVDAINLHGRYTVRLADADPQPTVVDHIRAVNGTDVAAVARVVATAELVTTAVSPGVLRAIAPVIARGLKERSTLLPPVTIIACENLIGASEFLRSLVADALPAGTALPAVFPNCAVDRIIPVQIPDASDPLSVTVEPFFEWVIDLTGFGDNPVPDIPGATFVRDLPPYIERKLFTVNTGHAALAYLGYRAGYRYIHEAFTHPQIHATVVGALRESGNGLVTRHRLDPAEHDAYMQKTLGRFANARLPDEVTRVGRSPLRKLSRDERLVAPARYAIAAGMQPPHLARVIAAALHFDPPGDPEAVELQARIRSEPLSQALTHITGLSTEDSLHQAVMNSYARS